MADNESTSVTKDLGIVSAYGYAKAAGYTGTEEDFEEIFLEFTEEAPGLIDRLEDAVDDCEDAKQDAEDAKTAAQNAQTAAEAAAATFSTDTTLNVASKAADSQKVGQAIAPVYSSSNTYAVGAVVLYNGATYRCTTAITTAEAWTAAHWTATNLGNEVSDLKTQINDRILLTDRPNPLPTMNVSSSNKYYYFGPVSEKNLQSESKKYLGCYTYTLPENVVGINCTNASFRVQICYFDETGSATTSGSTGFLGFLEYSVGLIYIPTVAKKIIININKADGTVISSDDITAFLSSLYFLRTTDYSLKEDGKAADAKETGDRLTEANNTVFYGAKIISPRDVAKTSALRAYAVSFSTGAVESAASGRFASNEARTYTTPLVLNLGLSDYLWHCWSYGDGSSYPNHSNTGGVLVDGTTPIFVQKLPQDRMYIMEFRRKDNAVLTTDTSDPDSDYSRILTALQVFESKKTPNELADGFIFRLDDNPDSIPIGESALSYSDFLEQTWDTLVTDYPTEVTKTAIGVSSTTASITTEYSIYKYVFATRSYSKTVFLSAGCHGNEYEGFWGLYRLMRMIYDEGYKYPNLRKLRHDVRFVIVPIWNPWGVENRVRNCPLGFPTQENLNASVTVDGTTYPAFTSEECKAIKAVLDVYDGELSLWVDFHTDPFSSASTPPAKKGCYGYAEQYSAINRVLYGLTVDFHNIIKDETNYSTNITIYDTDSSYNTRVPGYGNYRKVPSAVIEVSVNEFANSGTADIMKYAQEWYGNVVSAMIATT